MVHARRGQPHPSLGSTTHNNSSASYTGRPKAAGTPGSMRSTRVSSGLVRWRVFTEEAAVVLECRRQKVVGKPYEGKPHVRFEVAGDGDQDTVGLVRHSQRKRGVNR